MRAIDYVVRKAWPSDIPALRAMQERAMRALGGAFYTPAEVAAFVCRIGTMDDDVVFEGNFFLAESAHGALLGSGGWSQLVPTYGKALGAARRFLARYFRTRSA